MCQVACHNKRGGEQLCSSWNLDHFNPFHARSPKFHFTQNKISHSTIPIKREQYLNFLSLLPLFRFNSDIIMLQYNDYIFFFLRLNFKVQTFSRSLESSDMHVGTWIDFLAPILNCIFMSFCTIETLNPCKWRKNYLHWLPFLCCVWCAALNRLSAKKLRLYNFISHYLKTASLIRSCNWLFQSVDSCTGVIFLQQVALMGVGY